MRDTLKDYIDQHRGELDSAVPSDKLWAKIETSMIVAIPAAGITSGIPWLKYFGFGLSSVAGAAIVYTAINSASPNTEETSNIVSPAKTILMEAPAQQSISTPAADEFILMNTAAQLPPAQNSPEPESTSALPLFDTVSPQAEPQRYASAATLDDTTFKGIKRVEIISSSAKIFVKGNPGSDLSVTEGAANDSSVKIEYTRIDTLLRINARVECGKPKIQRSRKAFVYNSCTSSAVLTINVPNGTSVVVQNNYGDSDVSGVNAPVCEVRTSSGDVKVSSIVANTNVIASYGDLDASNITGNLTARLSSGSATVKNVKGNVDVVSTYGDQEISDITGNLKANGSSGNIRISHLIGDVNANTTYGDISINDFKGSARLISSSGSINGEGVELTANSTFVTTYGDVRMNLINPLEALSFELVTTYGEISIDKNGEKFTNDSRLNLKRGNILIKATSSSGDQVFR